MELSTRIREATGIRLVDIAVALGLLAAAFLTVGGLPDPVDIVLRERDVLGFALLAGQTVPLIWRQVAPRLMFMIILVAWVTDVGLAYEGTIAGVGVVVAMHAIGAFLPRKQALVTAGIALVVGVGWTLVGTFVSPGIGPFQIFTVVLVVTVPFAMGRADASKRDRLTELEITHLSAHQAQQEASDAAVRTERARIARELHDVVAHEITVMTLQAEGARRQPGAANPQVSEALATISDSGRKGLEEMQRMIGVLRDTSEHDPGDEPAVGTPHVSSRASDLSPVPALSSLPALAKQVEGSGLPVELNISGNAHVPAGVELSAYRIVQESLTNALKHAGPGATATVTVKRAKNAVTVTVEDDGRGVISDATKTKGGHGLAGMRERVLALGGSIEFGPRPGGGFRVRATLPSHDDTVTPARKTR